MERFQEPRAIILYKRRILTWLVLTLPLQKSRMLQTQGIEGEAVVAYREPSIAGEMRYPRLSRRVKNVANFLYSLQCTMGCFLKCTWIRPNVFLLLPLIIPCHVFYATLGLLLVIGAGSASPVFSDGLTIGNGSTLTLNSSTLTLNCSALRVMDGGSLEMGTGAVEYCGNLLVSSGGQVTWDTGTLAYCDLDEDGLPDHVELAWCTDPDDADTDDDGIIDGLEDANHSGTWDAGETDPCSADTDGDLIQDGTERGYTLAGITPDTNTAVFRPDLDPTTTTDPLDSDTDNDGYSDGYEDANLNGRLDPGETDPNRDSFPWESFYPAFIKKR